MHRTLRRLVPALLLVVGACAPLRRGSGPEPATIYFINESLDQADVYVVVGSGEARRIGTVMSGRTDTLTIPPSLMASGGSMTIVARLLARSLRPSTGPITVLAGEAYEVRLPADEKLLSFLPAND